MTGQIRDRLWGALIGLARTCTIHIKSAETDDILIHGILTASSCDPEALTQALIRVQDEKEKLAPDCALCPNPCTNSADYDMDRMYHAPADVRQAKEALLSALVRLAEAHTRRPGADPVLLYKGLFLMAEDRDAGELLTVAEELEDAAKA